MCCILKNRQASTKNQSNTFYELKICFYDSFFSTSLILGAFVYLSISCFITDYSQDDYKTNISFVPPEIVNVIELRFLYGRRFIRRADYFTKWILNCSWQVLLITLSNGWWSIVKSYNKKRRGDNKKLVCFFFMIST